MRLGRHVRRWLARLARSDLLCFSLVLVDFRMFSATVVRTEVAWAPSEIGSEAAWEARQAGVSLIFAGFCCFSNL